MTRKQVEIDAHIAAEVVRVAKQTAEETVKTSNEVAQTVLVQTAKMGNDIDWMKKTLDDIGVTLKTADFAETKQTQNDHETRIRGLENKIAIWAGGLAIIAIVVPIVVTLVLRSFPK